ncbi:MAG TPA: hypothetical protein VGL99_31905 [Chloroflexota bacterium]
MPRRQQRRVPRRIKGDRSERREDTSALDASARRILAATGGDARQLDSIVLDLRQLRDDADRRAFEDPSPDALRDYRRAARELAEAERAIALSGGR